MNHCGGLLPDRSSSALSHFLTRNADPYMNGGVQGPSPLMSWLAPIGESQGNRREGKRHQREVCRAVSLQGAIGWRGAISRRSEFTGGSMASRADAIPMGGTAEYSIWRVILASAVGTMIEWYDFYIFGSL